MAKRKRKGSVERIEQLSEHLLDICAAERRLGKTLIRLRVVRAALIAELASEATAVAEDR